MDEDGELVKEKERGRGEKRWNLYGREMDHTSLHFCQHFPLQNKEIFVPLMLPILWSSILCHRLQIMGHCDVNENNLYPSPHSIPPHPDGGFNLLLFYLFSCLLPVGHVVLFFPLGTK